MTFLRISKSVLGIVAHFLPCITYAANKRRCEHLNNKGTPDPEKGGPLFNNDCLIEAAVACIGCGCFLPVRYPVIILVLILTHSFQVLQPY